MSLIPNKDQEEMNKMFPLNKKTSLEQFKELGGSEENNPLDRLRFFCSLAMSGQYWLDSERFFYDIEKELRK
jgi:hypothetical protein